MYLETGGLKQNTRSESERSRRSDRVFKTGGGGAQTENAVWVKSENVFRTGGLNRILILGLDKAESQKVYFKEGEGG